MLIHNEIRNRAPSGVKQLYPSYGYFACSGLSQTRPRGIRQIDDSHVNINEASVQVWDFIAKPSWSDASDGSWRMNFVATFQVSDLREDPLCGNRQLAGDSGAPHWRGGAIGSYQHG